MKTVRPGARPGNFAASDPAPATPPTIPPASPPASMPGARAHRADPSALWLRLWNWCEAALRDFCYLVLPAECAVCGCEDHGLCLACAAALRRETSAPFRAEGAADALMGVAGEAHLAVMAGGVYRDTLAASILAFKNHCRTELGPPLARCLVQSLHKALSDIVAPPQVAARTRHPVQEALVLVPIPSSGSGWRRRGFDPVALLLKMVVREGRLPEGVMIARLLRSRAKLPWQRRHQKGLGRSARRANVHHCMRVRPGAARKFLLTAKPSGQHVLVIDDVLTTGSTLREAVETLESWGFLVVGAVVLGATRAPDQVGPAMGSREELAENNLGQKMNKTCD